MYRARQQAPAILIAAILGLSATAARAQDIPKKQPAQRPHTLEEYFALSERARAGDVVSAVAELRTWNPRAFRDFRDELEKFRRGLEGPTQQILLRWERADIEALAMLHTETALRSERLSTLEVSHANWAKQLLELFDGLNVDQSFRRRWHLAWGAYLQSTLRLPELADHSSEALRKWPEDPDVLTMAGSLYESSARRAVILRSDSDYLPMQYRARLERPNRHRDQALAESYYRRALDVKPDLFDARLRLGLMLLEANRFDEALAHVMQAAERAASPKEQYLARLFLGKVYASAQRWTEAVAAYSDADALFADCQSSALALSYVLVEQGERTQAQSQIKAVVERSNPKRCDDPWWEYEFGYGPRAGALFEQLWERLRR